MAPEFPKLKSPVIIAMKGLPCTAKSELGMQIGKWATSPVLYIDHFLNAVSLERGYTAESPPSPEEADRLHCLAFDALCTAASDNLRWGVDNRDWSYKCIVIKSRLSSIFEANRLVQLAREQRVCGIILIVNFQVKNVNEYRFLQRLENKVESGWQKEWYKARSWKDIIGKEAMEGDHDWDHHLRRLLDDGGGLPRVARLVFDPFDDLYIGPPATFTYGSEDIMKKLMCSLEVEQDSNKEDLLTLEGPYVAMHYRELQISLRIKRVRAAPAFSRAAPAFSGGRRKYLCGTRRDICVFKYWDELPHDKGKAYYCGICDQRVISGHPAYSCVGCFFLLHRSCAEVPAVVEGFEDIEFLRDFPNRAGVRKHACDSCKERGKGFSPNCWACLFQTLLKCRVLPTIVKNDCHGHFLTLTYCNENKCKACGIEHGFGPYYNCYLCIMSHDVECVAQLRQVKHEHGGHKHVLKLRYWHDGMEREEAYWCDICYEDMDPQNWFYSCQDCPYYTGHPHCVRLSGGTASIASSSHSN